TINYSAIIQKAYPVDFCDEMSMLFHIYNIRIFGIYHRFSGKALVVFVKPANTGKSLPYPSGHQNSFSRFWPFVLPDRSDWYFFP
ncbi:MAG: hypothetical protein WC375_06310, partial [Methanomassiliicoccales archaeon]